MGSDMKNKTRLILNGASILHLLEKRKNLNGFFTIQYLFSDIKGKHISKFTPPRHGS